MPVITSEQQAISTLLQGGVGVMPTDTVYGLVACATDQRAVARLYALKHREHKPGTVVAANTTQLIDLGVPEQYIKLVAHMWPNPLSVVITLPKTLNYLDQDVGSMPFRVVADDHLRSLLEKTGPLLTSSANQPGSPVASTIHEAQAYFKDDVDFYVDGGDLAGHAPSTIIRVIDEDIEVLRQGAVKVW